MGFFVANCSSSLPVLGKRDEPMPFETPILKVSRPVAACSRCRNAKIKCDGKLPACTSCEKNGRAAECTSTNDQFARGKERSYVSTLETRIEKLRAKIEEAKARKPSVISIPDDETLAPSRRPSQLHIELPMTPERSKAQRRKEASAIDDLVSDFGFLSVNATARDFYGFTTAMSYARLILSACTKDPLPKGTTKALPPRYEATQLVQHYLDNVFSLLPLFDEASLYASVDLVYSRDPRRADSFDHWLVRMVLAIASAAMSQARGDQHYIEGIGHVCAALEYSEAVLHPGYISSVQALVLLTQYAMLDPHHFDSWNLIGAASRAMVDLGLHQDPPKGATMHKAKLELRRRVFHCIYALDRSTSLVQTRAFSFGDASANVKIPYMRQPSSTPTSPAPSTASSPAWLHSQQYALDMINLRQLQSKWYTDVFQSGRKPWDEPYPYIWNACDGMRKWFDRLSPSTSPSMRAFFELELLYSYVYVLSPSPRVPNVHPYAQKLIFEYCIRYADLMLRLINDRDHTAPLTFYDAMRVYMTGRQFLDVLTLNADELLAGHVPSLPDVTPTTAAPPILPPSHPHIDNMQQYNIDRSINCMKQIAECLALFGMRWGYMSWNQRYQKEITPMLDNLNARLRELEALAILRRPSLWQHHNSTGSINSSNGSIALQPSPPILHHMSSTHLYPPHSVSPPVLTGYADHSGFAHPGSSPFMPQASPAMYSPPMDMYQNPPPQQMSGPAHGDSYLTDHAYVPVAVPEFNFGDQMAVHQQYQNAHLPRNQFAAWSGYVPAAHADTLDEENAVAPI